MNPLKVQVHNIRTCALRDVYVKAIISVKLRRSITIPRFPETLIPGSLNPKEDNDAYAFALTTVLETDLRQSGIKPSTLNPNKGAPNPKP